jgi:DNA-binding transcriptional regulator YiaG
MTDPRKVPEQQIADPVAGRPPETERMTGSELQVARVRLGLTRADLASVLSAGENTVRRWEIGKDPVSFRARDTINDIESAADKAVNSLIASLREMGTPRVVLFKEQESVGDAPPGLAAYGAGWWRAVAGRAAQQVPGTRIGTHEELAFLDTAISREMVGEEYH